MPACLALATTSTAGTLGSCERIQADLLTLLAPVLEAEHPMFLVLDLVTIAQSAATLAESHAVLRERRPGDRGKYPAALPQPQRDFGRNFILERRRNKHVNHLSRLLPRTPGSRLTRCSDRGLAMQQGAATLQRESHDHRLSQEPSAPPAHQQDRGGECEHRFPRRGAAPEPNRATPFCARCGIEL